MILHDSKIIFIHIPKTGGTTIERLLTENGLGTPDKKFGAHHRLEQVLKRPVFDDETDEVHYEYPDYSGYKIFTVARNPWDRYASMYVHDLKAYHDGIAKKAPPPIHSYMAHNVSENFFRFIEVDNMIPDNLMLINFDDFENEIRRVFKEFGVNDISIPHENKKQSKYREEHVKILKNKRFQKAVAKMCAAEIELFSYTIPLDN
jgi:hypothetical protein